VRVYDNLARGHAGAVPPELLVRGDLLDRDALLRALGREQVDAVMHFAALAVVGESVADPALYYRNNAVGTLTLLEAMRESGVRRIVFSSTCATYGEPERVPIREDAPQRPVNPYGFTKLVIEQALDDYARAYGFGYAALRYFNACGAAAGGDLGEDHEPETHISPWPSRWPSAGGSISRSSGSTTLRRMAPASATTSTSTTWRRPTCGRSRACARAKGCA
jgi:UDP-glucose 4-epimerase